MYPSIMMSGLILPGWLLRTQGGFPRKLLPRFASLRFFPRCLHKRQNVPNLYIGDTFNLRAFLGGLLVMVAGFESRQEKCKYPAPPQPFFYPLSVGRAPGRMAFSHFPKVLTLLSWWKRVLLLVQIASRWMRVTSQPLRGGASSAAPVRIS